MKTNSEKTIILLSGPACVGKGPLISAIKSFYPNINFDSVPVIKSKKSRPDGPRPDEILLWDNKKFFREEEEFEVLKSESRYIVGKCRETYQAIDTQEFIDSKNDLIVIEAYYTLGSQLNKLKSVLTKFQLINVFISPFSINEINQYKKNNLNLESIIFEIMLSKLNLRSIYQGKNPSDSEIKMNNIKRAIDSYLELKSSYSYAHILVNHDGEGNPNWNRFPNGSFFHEPIGDARKLIEEFKEILETGDSNTSEHWSSSTII